MGAGLAHAQGTPSPAADFIAAAAGVYMKGRKSLQAAAAHEHARMLMLGKWRRRAGCKQRSIDSPRQNWETRWLGSGAARDPNGHITQRVLAMHFDRVPLPMSHLGCGPAAGPPPWHPEGGRPRGWRSSWCLGAPPLGRLAARLAVPRGCAVGVLPAARVLRCRRVPGFAWRLPSTSVPLLT